MFDDPDDKLGTFNQLFLDVLDQHAPLKTVRVRKKPSPWISRCGQRDGQKRYVGSTSCTDAILLQYIVHLGTFARQNEIMLSGFRGRPR